MAGVFTNPGAQAQQGQAQNTSIAAQTQQQNLMNQMLSSYLGTAANPSTTMAGDMSMTPSLSTGNLEGIQNSTQAAMASRGFSQAPDMWQAALANAVGNAQMGMQNIGAANYQAGQTLPLGVPQSGVSGYGQTQIGTPGADILGKAAGGAAGAGLALALLA